MPHCWWLVVVLLALVHHGKAQDNITEYPVPSTTAKPWLIQRWYTSLTDLIHGKKPEVPPTNTTLNRPINKTSDPEAEPAIHKLHISPALAIILDKRNQSVHSEGSKREPKCLPVIINVSTTTDNSNSLEDHLFNVFAEIENMTIDLTPALNASNLQQLNGSFGSNVTGLRVGKGLINEHLNMKDSNRGARCGFLPANNASAKTDNSDALLNRVFKLFSEIENSTINATSTNVTRSSNRTQALLNSSLGDESQSLLRVGKKLEVDDLNISVSHHGNNSKMKSASLKSHVNSSAYNASNESQNSTDTIPRSLFHKYFGLDTNDYFKNHTYRIARYIKHVSKIGTRNHSIGHFLDKMKAYNWTYAKTAVYIIKCKLHCKCNFNCSRESRNLAFNEFKNGTYNGTYNEYPEEWKDLFSFNRFEEWKDLFSFNRFEEEWKDLFSFNRFEEEWKDLFSFNRSEEDWTDLFENPRPNLEIIISPKNLGELSYFETDNDTIEIIFDSETEFLDNESRQLEIHPRNVTDQNSTLLRRPLQRDNETIFLTLTFDDHSGIPKSVASVETSNKSTSDSNSTMPMNITPKFDFTVEVLTDNTTTHEYDNITSLNITSQRPGLLQVLLNESSENNGTVFLRWNSINIENNATLTVTPKWEDLFEIEIYNTTEVNLTSREMGPNADILNENGTSGLKEDYHMKIAEIAILAHAEIEIVDRSSNLTFNDTWIEHGANVTDIISISNGDNSTRTSFDHHQLVFTLLMEHDNSTENVTVRRNITRDGLHFLFTLLNSSYTSNGTDDRYSYNTSVGSQYTPAASKYPPGENHYHFHLQDQDVNISKTHISPHPSEGYFIEQPPFVWREPSDRLKIYIPPPLWHHFRNPAMPHLKFPNLKLVCPHTMTQRCPPWLLEGMRKCYFPMDCPQPNQLCCQVGCAIECVDGVLVSVPPHFY